MVVVVEGHVGSRNNSNAGMGFHMHVTPALSTDDCDHIVIWEGSCECTTAFETIFTFHESMRDPTQPSIFQTCTPTQRRVLETIEPLFNMIFPISCSPC